MTISPQPKSLDLVRSLQEIRAGMHSGTFNEFSLRHIEQEARTLLKTAEFSTDGYAILAACAAMRGKCADYIEQLEKAKKLSCWRVVIPHSLELNDGAMLGLYNRCYELLIEHKDSAGTLDALQDILSSSIQIGCYDTAFETLDRLERLNFKDKLRVADRACLNEYAVLKDQGIPEEFLRERVAAAAHVITSTEGARIVGASVNGFGHFLRYQFIIFGLTDAQILDLDWAIAECLVTEFEDPMDEIFTISATTDRAIWGEQCL